MSDIVKSVHVVSEGSWVDALADALMAVSKDAGDTLVGARSYCDKYDYIEAVALLVSSHDPEDRSEWSVGLFSSPPEVGAEV